VTYVHYLRKELIQQGHRVSVFSRRIGKTNKDPQIYLVAPGFSDRHIDRLKFLASRATAHATWGRYIAEKIHEVHRNDPIDILEMEEFWGWCAEVRERLSIPVVVKLHGPAFLDVVDDTRNTALTRARVEVEGRALRQMPAITSPSLDTLRSTVARYDLHPSIGKVIPNPMPVEGNPELWAWDRCDRKTILFVGRFDKRKGGDIALVAFRELLEKDESLKLLFVGPDRGVTSANGSLVFFEEFCKSLFTPAQRSRISNLGQLRRDDIFSLRRQAAVTLVVSRWENQPNTALEAMVQACPIVALDSGGVSEIVQHEVTGLLCRQDDVTDLCEKIRRLMSEPGTARQLGENARRWVIERHSVDKLARQTLDTYRETLSLRR